MLTIAQPHVYTESAIYLIFVSASHQIGLDSRSMTRRSIIVGEGKVGHEPRLEPCWAWGSLAYFVQCGPEPSWSWNQIWVLERMPKYNWKWTARSRVIQWGQKVLVLQLAHPKVAQPNSGVIRPQVCHGALTIRHGCQTVSKLPSPYKCAQHIYEDWDILINVHR